MSDIKDKVTMLRYSYTSGNMEDAYMFWYQLRGILLELIERLEKLEAKL